MNDFHHTKISLGSVTSEWDLQAKRKLTEADLVTLLTILQSKWGQLAGGIAVCTRPIGFSGAKSRKLIVQITADGSPPWGGWKYRSKYPHKRRHFTRLRAQINEQLAALGHEVDHIEFG